MTGGKKCGLKGIAMILVVIGALVWLLVGLLNFNLVDVLTGRAVWIERLIYIAVGLSGIYLLIGCGCRNCKSGTCSNGTCTKENGMIGDTSAKQAMGTVADKTKHFADDVKDMAGKAADKAEHLADEATDKAEHMAKNVAEKVRDAADDFVQRS